MDAKIEIDLKTMRDICNFYKKCENECPLKSENRCVLYAVHKLTDKRIGEIEINVKKWLQDHPKSRGSVFLEQYPNASTADPGIPAICPKFVDRDSKNADGFCDIRNCPECRKRYWSKPIED